MGYGLEVELIARAHALDLLTTPYVFSEAEATAMAAAGADIVVCHLGLTTGGAIGARDRADAGRLRAADRGAGGGRARRSARRRDRALPRRPDRDARRRAYILAHCPSCHGFYGASSMERLPVETALTETTRRFTQIRSQETDHDRRPIRQLHPRPDRRRDRRRDRRLAAPLALPAQLEGALVRAHRARRPEGRPRRRRVRAADRPRRHPGQHEHAAPRGHARPRQGADHARPDARRPDRRVLRARRGARPRRSPRRRRRSASARWSPSS